MSSGNYFKIMLVGDESVGKTSLISRYISNDYIEHCAPTLGVDVFWKEINKGSSGKRIKLQIWDTSGQKKFARLRHEFINAMDAFIIVFDATNKEAFKNVKQWFNELRINNYNCSDERLIIVLVATKCDSVEAREVDEETARNFAESKGAIYFETNAKENIGINKAFQGAVDKLMFRNFESNVYPMTVYAHLFNDVIEKLNRYIERIKSHNVHNTPDIDFKHGFWFFKESRALNRKANYHLALELKKELERLKKETLKGFKDGDEHVNGIKTLFADYSISEKREKCIKNLGLKDLSAYVKRGINSNELNGIINDARKLTPNESAALLPQPQ